MSALKTSITLIGPWPSHFQTRDEITIFRSWSEAQSTLKKKGAQILGVGYTTLLEKSFQNFIAVESEMTSGLSLLVVAPPEIPAATLAQLRRSFPVHFIVHRFDEPSVATYLQKALELSRWKGHFQDLARMREQHNMQLESLQHQLKERIEKKTKSLTQARKRMASQLEQTDVAISEIQNLLGFESVN